MGEHECGSNCDCDKEMTTEEIVANNNIVLNTLIDLLIEKKVLSEEELRKRLEDIEETQKEIAEDSTEDINDSGEEESEETSDDEEEMSEEEPETDTED